MFVRDSGWCTTMSMANGPRGSKVSTATSARRNVPQFPAPLGTPAHAVGVHLPAHHAAHCCAARADYVLYSKPVSWRVVILAVYCIRSAPEKKEGKTWSSNPMLPSCCSFLRLASSQCRPPPLRRLNSLCLLNALSFCNSCLQCVCGL